MQDILSLSAVELGKKIAAGEISSVDATKAYLDKIGAADKDINAYITVDIEGALKAAVEADKRIAAKKAAGEAIGPFEGVPVAIKDNMCIEGMLTTCASHILDGFKPTYTSTAVEKLIEAGAVILGHTNMDEFAAGSSTETSVYGPTNNPNAPGHIPGGSSGGSACTVAAKQCFGALGTDTGGSIREPASFCGVVGLKPTYGRVSRFGVVAFASSLDQVGPLTRTVEDSALMLSVLSGQDKHDMTASTKPVDDYLKDIDKGVKGLKIGIPKQFFNDKLDPQVMQSLTNAIQTYKQLGAEIVDVDLKSVDTALSVYYIISSAEAASNLARFDGVKYGVRAKNYEDLVDLYYKSRTQGFGKEVKRRIMLGNYVLSSGYFDAYYNKAKKVQQLIKSEFINAFKQCDVILAPTTATVAFKLGEKSHDPVSMYLTDIFTVPVNIAGIPSISIPCGKNDKGMPIGMQLMAKHFNEATIFRVANAFEKTTKEGK